MYVIYKYTNLINGKMYVGLTRRENDRIKEHKRANGKGSLFHHAVKKYGMNSFVYSVVEHDIKTKEEAEKREIFYITELGTYGKNGYNLTPGGELGPDRYGEDAAGSKIKTEIARKILLDSCSHSDASRKYGLSPSTIFSMRNGEIWKHLNRENIPEYKNGKTKINKEVAQQIIDDQCSISQASKKYGLSLATINEIRNGIIWKEANRTNAPDYHREDRKLTNVEAQKIINDSRSTEIVAREYSISNSSVRSIRNGNSYSHLNRSNKPKRYQNGRVYLTKEEKEKIATDPRDTKKIAEAYSCSRNTVTSIKQSFKEINKEKEKL